MQVTIKQYHRELIVSSEDPALIYRLRKLLLEWTQTQADFQYATIWDVKTETPQPAPPPSPGKGMWESIHGKAVQGSKEAETVILNCSNNCNFRCEPSAKRYFGMVCPACHLGQLLQAVNGGIKCDVTVGPCACGATHDEWRAAVKNPNDYCPACFNQFKDHAPGPDPIKDPLVCPVAVAPPPKMVARKGPAPANPHLRDGENF